MLTTVTSHVRGLPPCRGINVSPSGRLPSIVTRPTGSLVTGTPATGNDVIDGVMPGYFSTSAPHLQEWATQTLQPRWTTIVARPICGSRASCSCVCGRLNRQHYSIAALQSDDVLTLVGCCCCSCGMLHE